MDPNLPPPPGNMDGPPGNMGGYQQNQQFAKPPQMNQQFNENEHQPQVPGHLLPPPQLDQQQNWWQQWQSHDQLKINENYRMFRIPKLKEDVTDSTIIGVIDQSGSMGDCFHWLAREWNEQIYKKYQKTRCCIFHNFALEQEFLEEDPQMGTTDVEAGFTLLNQVINRQNIDSYVTIIFISDGADNNPNSIYDRLEKLRMQIPRWKKINFLTIGVGEQFPTKMAMHLRSMYHNGENNIPPVFLVYNQEVHENWKVTFQIVNKYLSHNDPVQINSFVQQFPWTPPTQTVYENSWVFTTDMNCNTINLQGGLNQNCIEKLTPQEVLDVSSILLSNAQISNLKFNNPDNTKAEVTVAEKVQHNLKRKFWGRSNKKKEEKEQLEAVEKQTKSLKENPNLKEESKDNNDGSLALKLAVGAIGAGIGLYWLSGNYMEFSNIMSNMDFIGTPECGCCGELCEPVCNVISEQCECCGDIADKIMGTLNCDSCSGCLEGACKAGESCMGQACEVFCNVVGYVCNFICGFLAG